MAESAVIKWWDRTLDPDELAQTSPDALMQNVREDLLLRVRTCAAVAQWKRRISYGTPATLALDKKRARWYGHRILTVTWVCEWTFDGQWHTIREGIRDDSEAMRVGAVLQWDEWRRDLLKEVEAHLIGISTYVMRHAVGNPELRRLCTALDTLRTSVIESTL